ncbi:formylglycine-generating enzyme family protein [Haloferula sp.]|uniref:formylglycine-generating enzyme family protein n=1 Tax=Haloferula sp. TaxID=2497595 RepID=UPI003C71E09D
MSDRRSFLDLVEVPSGTFEMGGIADDKFVSAVELPRHEVSISEAFMLGVTPVTRGEWIEVMGRLPGSCRDDLDDACPVVGMSFSEIGEFLRELGGLYRLPTEAEWEYACRAGSRSVFPHGSDLGVNDANFYYDERGIECGAGRPVAVGRYPANGFGLHDMLGNVCEWTVDRWHPGYEGAPADGRAWLDGGKAGTRVIRGGGWDHLPRVLRVSWRDWAPDEACWDNLGLRLARDL